MLHRIRPRRSPRPTRRRRRREWVGAVGLDEHTDGVPRLEAAWECAQPELGRVRLPVPWEDPACTHPPPNIRRNPRNAQQLEKGR